MQYVKAPATSYRNMQRVVVSAATIAAAILIAGAALTLNSAQTEATPNKVTAKKPCGSCHPPNKPPRR
jgi:cell division protein FtsN